MKTAGMRSSEQFRVKVLKMTYRDSIFSFCFTSVAFLCFALVSTQSSNAEDLKLLFLGDNGHHRPVDRFAELATALAEKNIDLKYTDQVEHLNLETLNQFDGLVLYANIDEISKSQADALLTYVASGKGFIPLHCATYCFRNDPRIVGLMGAQFQRRRVRCADRLEFAIF